MVLVVYNGIPAGCISLQVKINFCYPAVGDYSERAIIVVHRDGRAYNGSSDSVTDSYGNPLSV